MTKNTKKKSLSAPTGAGVIMPINLTITPVEIHPVAALALTPVGLSGPIMREGFITETGLLVT